MKAVNFSLRYGHTDQSSYAYAVHALTLVSVYGELVQAFEFSEMALQLNDRFDNARLRGTLLHLHGDHVNFWRRHFATGVPILEQGFRACLEVGDLVYAGHLAFLTVWQAIERGVPLAESHTLATRNARVCPPEPHRRRIPDHRTRAAVHREPAGKDKRSAHVRRDRIRRSGVARHD